MSRHLPGEKLIQLNKHVLQAIYSLPLITFHTNICPNLVPLSGLDFFLVHCSREIARRGEIAKSHAVGLKKQFGMGELRSFLVDTFIGDEYPNLYLEPKWPPVLIGVSALFWGVDLQKVIGALGMISKLNIIIPTSQVIFAYKRDAGTLCSNQS